MGSNNPKQPKVITAIKPTKEFIEYIKDNLTEEEQIENNIILNTVLLLPSHFIYAEEGKEVDICRSSWLKQCLETTDMSQPIDNVNFLSISDVLYNEYRLIQQIALTGAVIKDTDYLFGKILNQTCKHQERKEEKKTVEMFSGVPYIEVTIIESSRQDRIECGEDKSVKGKNNVLKVLKRVAVIFLACIGVITLIVTLYSFILFNVIQHIPYQAVPREIPAGYFDIYDIETNDYSTSNKNELYKHKSNQ